MGLRDRINSIFSRSHPPEQTTAGEVQQELDRRKAQTPDVASVFKTEKGRLDDIKHSRDVYDGDTRAKRIITTAAFDVTKAGFVIEMENEAALEVVEAVRDRLKLDGRLDDWVRMAMRDGDNLLQLEIDDRLQIVDASRKPTLNMRRNSNDRDRFDDPAKAFWFSERPWMNRPDKDTIYFAEWEIVHARWDHDEGERYGRPLFAAGKKSYKRLDQGELDIAVRRKVRSGLKFVHILDTTDEGQIDRYMERNKAAIDNPMAAVSDFFMNGQGDIKAIEGDARLGEITDIRHHLNTWWLNSPVPMAILGYGQDIDFSVIGHQKEQYDETLDNIWDWVVAEFLDPLIERQLLLAGILPESAPYKISRPPKAKATPADIRDIVDAAIKMQMLGVSSGIIATVIARFLPGITPDMLLPDGKNFDPERLAAVTDNLQRGFGGGNAPDDQDNQDDAE